MAVLHSLLIGITDYPSLNKLNGCITDVNNVQSYILGLDQFVDSKEFLYKSIRKPILLLNDDATKSNISNTLTGILEELRDEDTLLFYFSGHGAEEIAPGRFFDDHGLLQCLVCYFDGEGTNNYLLADKELRYLFNKSETKAHIVGIFDCCHSGDITRAAEQDKNKSIKRIASNYPERQFEEFLFSKAVEEHKLKKERFNGIFPDINLITLSASASNESSWENNKGGYFTNALLQCLISNNGLINYGDLMRECRIRILNNTKERQTPVIDILGAKRLNQLTSWLRLNGDKLLDSLGYINYYPGKGWIYSKGSIHGVMVNDKLIINISGLDHIQLPITKITLSDSYIQDPLLEGLELNRDKKYPVILNSKTSAPKIAIENLDGDKLTEELLITFLKDSENIEIYEHGENCDFQLNIFNELLYFSKANDPYRPLSKQIDLLSKERVENALDNPLKKYLTDGAQRISNWHQIKNLNLGEGFDKIPIKIEFKNDLNDWTEVTNGEETVEASGRDDNNQLLYSDFELRLSNTSNEDILYITVLALDHSSLEIGSEAFDETSFILKKDQTKNLTPKSTQVWLDYHQEVYNWEQETVDFIFIVNNYRSLAENIGYLTQEGFEEPLHHINYDVQRGKDVKKGIGKLNGRRRERSAIYSFKLRLKNPYYNQITGLIELEPNWYQTNEIVAPFIEKLYYDINVDLFNYELANKPSSDEEAYRGSIKMFIGNTIDYTRRNRKFRKMRRQYPDEDIVVAEGDSWFLYPILVKDTIDYIMESWPVKSLAWAGDTLENYIKSGQLLKTVNELKPHPQYVLISGGGNDIIGKEIRNLLEPNAKNIKSPRDYLNKNYDQQMNKLKECYIHFFNELNKLECIKKILVHGYDYIRPDHARIVVKGGWLNKYLEEFGIEKAEDRGALIKFLIDKFNDALEEVARPYPKVKYLNLRELISRDEWYDEIHPNDQGYERVAQRFIAELT